MHWWAYYIHSSTTKVNRVIYYFKLTFSFNWYCNSKTPQTLKTQLKRFFGRLFFYSPLFLWCHQPNSVVRMSFSCGSRVTQLAFMAKVISAKPFFMQNWKPMNKDGRIPYIQVIMHQLSKCWHDTFSRYYSDSSTVFLTEFPN